LEVLGFRVYGKNHRWQGQIQHLHHLQAKAIAKLFLALCVLASKVLIFVFKVQSNFLCIDMQKKKNGKHLRELLNPTVELQSSYQARKNCNCNKVLFG
jgi:hypothetical protein